MTDDVASSRKASVNVTRSWGATWSDGEGLVWKEGREWHGLFCVRARRIGPRGGIRAAALMAEGSAPTRKALISAVEAIADDLHLDRPPDATRQGK